MSDALRFTASVISLCTYLIIGASSSDTPASLPVASVLPDAADEFCPAISSPNTSPYAFTPKWSSMALFISSGLASLRSTDIFSIWLMSSTESMSIGSDIANSSWPPEDDIGNTLYFLKISWGSNFNTLSSTRMSCSEISGILNSCDSR